ncbi:energy transducer TonB [Longimicrobium sp.]|uniref:energy transducer TonB n=1 Tax=Longimicrobium sp. TaxID=2029185 RepID=UPI002CD2B160|nr:energy transducer TonB [Longimicrobium sp.]HSU13902.1 energy transducer TonB [Longimicrobium sp.]
MADLALAPHALMLRRRSDGAPLALDPALEIGVGGEARVLGLPGDASLVAKLYHDPTLARARKVARMIDVPPALPPGVSIAWPTDLLTDLNGGRFAGFLMPRAEGPRIFEFYNPISRRRTAPLFDYAWLHRAGRNLAAAFDALHAAGYVVGDVNESNILVSPRDAAVTLVDADSFQVRDPLGRIVHRSGVGKAEFTPPELQGARFADVDRTPEHDRFGLSVLLFLLLMEGTHPYASRLGDGGEIPPVEERISRGLFPHARPDDECRPPRLAPPFWSLDPAVRVLFMRCFVAAHADAGQRPSPAEWLAALETAEARLVTCRANPRHRFGPHIDFCPWCHRARLLQGRDPFPATVDLARAHDTPRPAPRPRPAQLAHAQPYAPHPPAAPFAPAAPAVPAQPPLVVRAARMGMQRAYATLPAWAQPAFGPAAMGNPLVWMAPAALTCLFGATGGVRMAGLMIFFLALRRVFSGGVRLRGATVVWAVILMIAWAVVGGGALSGAFARDDLDVPVTPIDYPAMQDGSGVGAVTVPDLDAVTTEAPRLLNRDAVSAMVARRYPAVLRDAGIAADVRVRFLVRDDGSPDVGTLSIIDAGASELAGPAGDVVAEMRFDPAVSGGRTIAAWVETTIRFAP